MPAVGAPDGGDDGPESEDEDIVEDPPKRYKQGLAIKDEWWRRVIPKFCVKIKSTIASISRELKVREEYLSWILVVLGECIMLYYAASFAAMLASVRVGKNLGHLQADTAVLARAWDETGTYHGAQHEQSGPIMTMITQVMLTMLWFVLFCW